MDTENQEKRLLEAHRDYGDAIFRQCLFRVGGDREIAIDLTQDTFLKTWDYLQKGNEVHNLKAFIFKVAHNLIKDYWRKKKPILEKDMEEGYFSSIEDPALSPIEKAEYDRVERAIYKLDEAYRDVVLLRLIEEYPVKEIAALCNITESNASVRIHRGIKQLKKILHHEQ